MVPICRVALGALLAGWLCGAAQAAAGDTAECRSRDFGYTECAAPGLQRPQLVYQISSSACIVNRTWGFDRGRGVLWVDDGCAGRFADVDGYHHGRTGRFDPGARRYTAHGDDAGPFVGGQALGAFFEGAGSAADGGKPRQPSPPAPGSDATSAGEPPSAAPEADRAATPSPAPPDLNPAPSRRAPPAGPESGPADKGGE